MLAENILHDVKAAVRIKSDAAGQEVLDLIESCIMDLEISGVYVCSENDPLVKQAVKLYCKANYGYDENTERFREAYESLKISMSLSGDYEKGESYGNS